MTTNGETTELPEDRMKTVEAGLTMFQQVSAERDRLREELREAHEAITRARVEIDSLHQLHNMLESHIQSYMLQRDEAVAQRAAYETLFATIQAQLRIFNLPNVPLVKEVADVVQNQEPADARLAGASNPSGLSGQRAAVSDERAGQGEIPRRTPVLAHDSQVLGQPASGAKRPGWPSLGKQDPSRR